MLVETTTSNALVSCDGSGYDWSDQAEEGPTNFALMAYSSTSYNSEVSTDLNCSSSCLENVKILKEQNEQLLKDLRTSKLNAIAYKTGLESVEARLLFYNKNESVYEEDIKVLKREIYLRKVAITELRRKLELAQKKDEIQLTVENFENSSKNLSKLIDCDQSLRLIEDMLPLEETSKEGKSHEKLKSQQNGVAIEREYRTLIEAAMTMLAVLSYLLLFGLKQLILLAMGKIRRSNMPALEDIVFQIDDEDVGAERRGKIDKTLFIRRDKGDILLVQVYVDDIIFGSTKKSLCTEFEKMMHKKFQMSSMGELTFFLGLQVKQKEDGIFISQDKYVTEILKKFGFTDVKTASTPMETQKLLLKDEDGEEVDVHLYRSMIGSLMYLTSSRPDIMFAVCACARYQVNPKVSHLHAVKRIFRYLKGQPKLGLWYPKDSPFDLVAYTDSDYAGASLDRKSTTGGCQFLGSRLISWQCKK
ncbi:uncharacterized mitochondrial protein-like protein [Tanacetum coccineum]|uniref:Uncharacterized mitochondrial protein-like protein n=1 Tax=Tanacetum coccineum TaxID=301880 RepID=A0ABQ4XC26_9ASTR